jgi:hypothetical protein
MQSHITLPLADLISALPWLRRKTRLPSSLSDLISSML